MRAPHATIAFAVLLFGLPSAPLRADDAPTTIDVWPATAPGETGQVGDETRVTDGGITRVSNVTKPTLTFFRPEKDKDTGAAVIINPGGGYSILAWDLEGEEVAKWLNSIGVTGILHKYRVPARPNQPRYKAPLQDAQRAVSLVRSKAGELSLDPKRIGMLGFSAGGNLTAVASTNWQQRAYEPIDDVDKVDCRPDFAVLVYPAWLAREDRPELVDEVPVDQTTPPMFLAHAGDDPIKVDASVVMYQALQRAKVPAELHVYATGGHGFGLRPSAHPCSHWPERCGEWMKNQKLLEPAKR